MKPGVLGWRRWAVGLLAGCASILLLQAGLSLWQVRSLQLDLDHLYVAAIADEAVTPALTARQRRVGGLRPVLEGLRQRSDLGLRLIAVYDAEGVLLSRVGSYEYWPSSWLPGVIRQTLRDTAYRLTGNFGSRRLFDQDHRFIGSVEYRIAPGSVAGISDRAVTLLKLAGWGSAVVALVMLAGLFFGLRSLRRLPPVWARRADPQPQVSASEQDVRLRAAGMMNAIGQGLILTDRDLRIRQSNTQAERLTGWPGEDALGQQLFSVLHRAEDDGLERGAHMEQAMAQGQRFAAVVLLRSRSSAVFPVELSVAPVRTRENALEGWLVGLRDVSAQQQVLELARREARLSQAVVDHLEEGLLTTDRAGVVRSANARAERMFGYTRNELIGFTISKLMPVPFLNVPGIKITDYLAPKFSTQLPKVVGWRKDATTFPVDLWVTPMRTDDSQGLVVIVRDISERLRGENLASRLGRLLDSAVEEIYIFDAQTLCFLEVNRGARNTLGYGPEVLERMTPLDISDALSEEDFAAYLARLRNGEVDHLSYRCRHRRADGVTYPVEVRLNYSRDEEPPVFMAIAINVSDRVAAEEKLTQLAHYDTLTGLPNRAMLYDRLQQAMLVAKRSPKLLGIYFLDLDRFKKINDDHGHEVGDQVLKAVADRMLTTVREGDTVARLAGDEFVILAPGLRSVDDAQFLAQKLIQRFEQPIDLPGLTLTSRTSIGIALYPIDDSDVEGLLRHADSAMYEAKQAGRGCFRLFTTEIDPQRRRRLELEREIHTAVAMNQFGLRFSPVCREGQVELLTAEVSWDHPRYGEVGHREVFQAAGRAGLVADLELWQLCQVCEAFSADLGSVGLPCVVPVSGWQLRDPEFNGHVIDLLQRYQVAGTRLILALSPDGLADVHAQPLPDYPLLAQGVRLALRDFNMLPEWPEELPVQYAIVDADQLPAMSDEIVSAAGQQLTWLVFGIESKAEVALCDAQPQLGRAGRAIRPSADAKTLVTWLHQGAG